jgi:hypothetical protein
MNTLCFIFSWKGQFANAINLEEQLAPFVDNLVVINSDDDNKPEHWINIGNECYFSDQFKKALKVADASSNYNIMINRIYIKNKRYLSEKHKDYFFRNI